MISIDFIAGSHGNFLEFACNKFIAGIDIDFSPFNSLGASHDKTTEYHQNKLFAADHYSELGKQLSKKLIRITYNEDDLLLLTSGALLRAGNAAIDNDLLEVDTYNKLINSKYYTYLIDSINTAYPDCKLSINNPNCPRYILREFFKFGFKDPQTHGFAEKLKLLHYPSEHNVIDFPYSSFYNCELFLKDFKKLSVWCNGIYYNEDSLRDVWTTFIENQIYKNYKLQCDKIIESIIALESTSIPKLALLQESYINGILEKRFEIEMPFFQDVYFKSTDEIIDHLCLK